MQMLLAPPPSPYNFWRDHRSVYHFSMAPSTMPTDLTMEQAISICLRNYATARSSYSYIDEQSFFSQRWRLAKPYQHSNGDYKGNFAMTLMADLATSPGPGGLYNWIKENFWSPFDDGYR